LVFHRHFLKVTVYGLVFTDITQNQVTIINRVFGDSLAAAAAAAAAAMPK
jgi:hypothetical protein